ncbi:transglutaminase domain-containing protein [Mangrovibacterium lignilyticum]|uniref:transglutaminase domain-containing protein n=1 Tax=Mangrovibacterium lignilyticum TaxID=2668052 RepID=UPI0013CFE6C8|nr:transglutaminase domain-containing protein [Mangrovibacterium lignilyticum]
MNIRNSIILALFVLISISCSYKDQLISNPEQLKDINHMLDVQKKLTANSNIHVWDIFDQPLTDDERQAMEYLYAYMPLSDLGDLPADFFLANVRKSLQTREDMTWGKSVPEDLFLHFVLPVRINNENLDSFRIVMYDEIKARVQGMKMEEAALEINHWCHEKVVYRGTDIRTSAPLSTIRKAFGRCGEMSTFTVSALRAAGIPARQVYTPRWAHSDDNHAWVEVWVDGVWKYLGACEPDARLNMGWFTEPSTRAILMHTRAYGKYFGPEDVINKEERFTELDVTANYARVKRLYVDVKNADGTPAVNTKVEYQLYNYAEYFPIATQYTNSEGETSLSMGLGDIIVWASQGKKFDFKRVSISQVDTVNLVLADKDMSGQHFDFDFVPPHVVTDTTQLSTTEKSVNEKRLALEDSIRSCYTETFKTADRSKALAKELGLEEEPVVNAIHLSYGNWSEIEAYLRGNAKDEHVLDLLKGISDKDFSDTKAAILSAHLQNTIHNTKLPEEIFVDYVLAPRVMNEMLRNWRKSLQETFAAKKDEFVKDPQQLTEWIKQNIIVDDMANMHSRTELSPTSVYKLRVSDAGSLDFFFVATCRALGIPARLNPATEMPEFWNDGEWIRAELSDNMPAVPETGKLVLANGDNPIEPQYMIHFTIGKLIDGNYHTLQYPFSKKVSEFGELDLEAGDYYLVTGNRLEDGSVLNTCDFFTIEPGKTKKLTVTLRQSIDAPKAIAKLDFSQLNILKSDDKMVVSLDQVAYGKNMVLALLDPNKETSKHILNDLGDYLEHFNAWTGEFVFIAAEDRPQLGAVLNSYHLPKNYISGFDQDNQVLKALMENFGDDVKGKLPLVILTDAGGHVFLFSSGYKIGIGEQLLKVIPAMTMAGVDSCCQP